MEESTVCIWQFVLFSVVGQLDTVCRGRCPHRPAVDCFISQINCHICNFHFNMVYYKSNTKSNTAQCPTGGEPMPMPISISTGRKMQMFLLDLIYPNRCPCCNCSISWREYLCEACRQEVTAEPADAFCPLCGKLLRECFCGTGLSYDRAAILTEYTGAARAGVLSMKSAASLHFGRFCGNVLGQRIAEDAVLSGYDLVVPVPMQLRKQRKRCCNPAAVFAREIAAVTRIPYRQDILHDNGTGKTQHTLSAAERHKNVEQFSAAPVSLEGMRVLLCDDVLTTGSTMNRCAALLKAQGAAEVAAISMTTTAMKSPSKEPTHG
jgi:competence protein ComFC